MARRRIVKKKNRLTAALLAFLGGIFGVHKFYLRETGGAFFYIFLFIASINIFNIPLTALLGFIEGMSLLSMSDRKFDQKYNKEYLRAAQNDPESVVQQTKTSTRRTPAKKSQSMSSKANPYKRSGITKYKEFALEEAIMDFEKGLEIQPNDVALHFNLACAYSLTEKKTKVLYHLDQAVANGFKDFTRITTHDDLAFIRIQPEFDAFKNKGFRLSGETMGPSIVKDDVLLSQLNRLADLRKKGILSENEFVVERKKLLNR